MADNTKIEWTDATWNPVTGCAVVSPGCTNCYAMKLAGSRLQHHASRAGLTRDTKAGPVWTGEVRFNREWLHQPLTWKRPRMIFVCAHGDLFAEGVKDGEIMQILSVMAQSPQHTFQVLTKRPERMRDFFTRWSDLSGEDFGEFHDARGPQEVRAKHPSPRGQLFADMLETMGDPPPGAAYPSFDWMGGMINWPDVFEHIWLGVSVEDQRRADERIPILLDTPAAVRWISAEPLLGPINIDRWIATADVTCKACQSPFWLHDADPCKHKDEGDGWTLSCPRCGNCLCKPGWTEVDSRSLIMEAPADWVDRKVGRFTKVHPTIGVRSMIDWVVAGGESGTGARPMHPHWAYALRDQCAAAGVPFLFKQWGNWAIASHDNGHVDSSMATNDAVWLDVDGRQAKPSCDGMSEPIGMFRTTKSRAGRLLQGVEHNEFPEIRKAI